MEKKLTNGQKISEKINKIIKKIYISYRSKKMNIYTNPRDVLVLGNSTAYAESAVIPVFKAHKFNHLIFTRVDEVGNLIGTYIISAIDLVNSPNVHWVTKKFVKQIGLYDETMSTYADTMYFYQFKYADFEKYNNPLLLKLVKEYRENK